MLLKTKNAPKVPPTNFHQVKCGREDSVRNGSLVATEKRKRERVPTPNDTNAANSVLSPISAFRELLMAVWSGKPTPTKNASAAMKYRNWTS